MDAGPTPAVHFPTRAPMPSHGRFLDLTGQRFGWLVVQHFVGKLGGYMCWLCRCDCGGHRVAHTGNLRAGHVRYCACRGSKRPAISRTPEYAAWLHIRHRIFNPKHRDYAANQRRGRTMCDRWRDSFQNFYEDLGPRPGPRFQLALWPDPAGNYEPGNCRWAPPPGRR